MAEGITDNFFHALWLDILPEQPSFEAYLDDRLKSLIRDLSEHLSSRRWSYLRAEPALWRVGGIRCAGFIGQEGTIARSDFLQVPWHFPLFEFGLAADNFIAVEVKYEANETIDPALIAMMKSFVEERGWLNGKLLDSLKQVVVERKPDSFVHGAHNCYINCGECCRKDYRFLAANGFCEYWTEIGGYCLPVLGERQEGRIAICKNWWCALVSRCTDGNLLEEPCFPRPHIKKISTYSEEQKLAFIKAKEMLSQGATLQEAADCLQDMGTEK